MEASKLETQSRNAAFHQKGAFQSINQSCPLMTPAGTYHHSDSPSMSNDSH